MKRSEMIIQNNILHAEVNECDKIARKENKHEIERGKALEKERLESLKNVVYEDVEIKSADDIQSYLEVRQAVL